MALAEPRFALPQSVTIFISEVLSHHYGEIVRKSNLLAVITLVVAMPLLFGVSGRLDAATIGSAITNPANQHMYYLLTPNTWTNSETEALTLGGHLVTINDAAENDFVFNTFTAILGSDAGLWIGLNDEAVEGAFVWSSGEPLTYTNWGGTEPNNYGGEDYAHMFSQSDPRADGSWNDALDLAVAFGKVMYGVVEVVPEPTTLALAGLGLLGIACVRRRRV